MYPFDFSLNEKDEQVRLDQLRAFLEHCKLSKYFETFVNEGFDSLLSLFDITEADLIALNVKRGHRRVIQRAIATARGIPLTTPIVIYYGYEEPGVAHMPKPGTTKIVNDNSTISTTTTTTTTTTFVTKNSPNNRNNDILVMDDEPRGVKRHHHSHSKRKKRKQYVPTKPVTPFAEYLYEVKAELNGMSESEILEIAQGRWNLLSPVEKEKYEREALHANSDYVMDRFLLDDYESDQSHDSIDFPTFDAVAGRYHRYRLAHRQSMPESDYHSFTSS